MGTKSVTLNGVTVTDVSQITEKWCEFQTLHFDLQEELLRGLSEQRPVGQVGEPGQLFDLRVQLALGRRAVQGDVALRQQGETGYSSFVGFLSNCSRLISNNKIL